MEAAIGRVLDEGYRTADLGRATAAGSRVQTVGTAEMGSLVAQALGEIMDRRQAYHTV